MLKPPWKMEAHLLYPPLPTHGSYIHVHLTDGAARISVTRNCKRESTHSGERKKERRKKKKPTEKTLYHCWYFISCTLSPEQSALIIRPQSPAPTGSTLKYLDNRYRIKCVDEPILWNQTLMKKS